MQDEAGSAEDAAKECRKRRRRFFELGEDERLLLLFGNDLRYL
jgi:hypothetical protein